MLKSILPGAPAVHRAGQDAQDFTKFSAYSGIHPFAQSFYRTVDSGTVANIVGSGAAKMALLREIKEDIH